MQEARIHYKTCGHTLYLTALLEYLIKSFQKHIYY